MFCIPNVEYIHPLRKRAILKYEDGGHLRFKNVITGVNSFFS